MSAKTSFRYTARFMRYRASRHRCLTVLLVVMSLLFSQLALAAYACPSVANTDAMAEMMAAGTPCTGMDKAQPSLCHEQGVVKAFSFEHAKVATPSLPAILQALVLPALWPADAAGLPLAAQPALRPPPDPVFLSTRRLRV